MNDSTSVSEDGSGVISVLANDTGLGDAPITVTISIPPLQGVALIGTDQTVTYTPTANYNGADSFTYAVTDADGDTDTGLVTITVQPVNDTPVAVVDTVTTAEDASLVIVVLANDLGVADLPATVVVTTAPAHGTATAEADGTVSYVPSPNYNGIDTFEYLVTDADSEFSTAAVTVTITPTDDAPDAINDVASTRVGEALDIDVLANDLDPDGGMLVLSSVTMPLHGVATVAAGKVHYVPTAGYTGNDTFSYTVQNGSTLEDTASVIVGIGTDTDGDGLLDVDELETYGTDPDLADSDGDLLDDGVEVLIANTDPLDDDTDDDGLLDGNEDKNGNGAVDASETSATENDTDGDGILDGTEAGLVSADGNDTDPTKFVADADPSTTTDPSNADTDGGGVDDGDEDLNHNGAVDADETDPNDPSDDPVPRDFDKDGIPDEIDNCAFTPNEDQADTDMDGIGDACAPKSEGGGCRVGTAGHSGAPETVVLLVGLGLMVTLRRRRRR